MPQYLLIDHTPSAVKKLLPGAEYLRIQNFVNSGYLMVDKRVLVELKGGMVAFTG